MTDLERLNAANKVSTISIIVNVALAAIKLLAGIIASSSAMIADGVHTLSEVASTIAVMVGMYFSSKPDDEGHPYGHEKIESVVAKMLAIMLAVTAIGIGYSGIKTIIAGEFTRPGTLALVAAIISIASKEWMYHFTVRTANKIDSPALKADAWHHRSDALSSVGTFIGIGGAIMGLEILDPLASLVVCGLIIKVAVEIYIAAFNQVIDRSADKETLEKIENTINSVSGVKHIDDVKTRMHGSKIYVDVEIAVDGSLTVYDGHKIAEEVHHKIADTLPEAKHCMVHVNPYKEK